MEPLIISALSLLSALCGYFARLFYSKIRLTKEENRLTLIKEQTARDAEKQKNTILLEAKESINRERTEFNRELKEKKTELAQSEKRLHDKEENLDQKYNECIKRENTIANREKLVSKQEEELKQRNNNLVKELERLSGLSVKEAREMLISSLEEEAKTHASKRINKIEEETRQIADKRAKYIIASSIQRLASEVTQENTITTVTLPSDEMKGRIIGREGRNIRTLESLTGVDIIIDDTPEAVIISCFDPVRREIASQTLKKLILDGRIHPTRIEELVLKVKNEIDELIKEEGEKVRMDLNIPIVKPEITYHIGRLKYRTSYGQNVLAHVKEVANLSGMIAGELGFNVDLAVRVGFLHDIGKAISAEGQGGHAQVGADFLKRAGEDQRIVEIVRDHHSDNEITHVETLIVQAADAISASRMGARRESFDSYTKRLTDLEIIAKSYNGVDKAYAIQAGREIRIFVNNDTVNDDNAKQLARDIAKQIEEKVLYPGQIKVAVIRETRAVEYAK